MKNFINKDEIDLITNIYDKGSIKPKWIKVPMINDTNRKEIGLESVKDYLIGNNKNLFGSIIGFKKGWRKNNSLIPHYSFLLYFSHETGRIERYYYNPGNKSSEVTEEIVPDIFNSDSHYLNVISSVNSYSEMKESNFISTAELENYLDDNFLSKSDLPSLLENYPLKLLNFKLLHDGKLNNSFFQTFLLELCRDYFIFLNSYKYPNINYIRTYTYPMINYDKWKNIFPNFKHLRNFKIGCGEVNQDLLLKT